MIFPSDSLIQLRRSFKARVAAGEVTDLEAFQEYLRRDPDDGETLTTLARKAEADGDFAAAERYARHLVRNRPSGHVGYILLSRLLGQAHANTFLERGYAALGMAKMQFDDDAMDHLDGDGLAASLGVGDALKGMPKEQVFGILYEGLMKDLDQAPAEVEEDLRPHRLVHELREHRDGVLDRTLVDAILKHGAVCEPLLLGILKEFGADLLTDDDYRMVERALVLLGEIGNPSVLPALIEFLTLAEEDLSGPADWAFRRISFQHPAETLERIREMLPAADAPERVVMGEQIAMIPKVPGRSAALAQLVEGVERFPKSERNAVVFSAIAGAYLLEGGKSFLAAQLERKYVPSFSGEARSDLRKLHREAEFLSPDDPSAEEYTVYEICCQEPADEDEDGGDEDDEEPLVKPAPKPGRNEPCWCGSGRKYKKCHLEQDQRS